MVSLGWVGVTCSSRQEPVLRRLAAKAAPKAKAHTSKRNRSDVENEARCCVGTVGERGAEDSFILLMLSRPQDGDGEALPKEEVGRGFPHICVCLLVRLFVRHIFAACD